jgi:hypothetical protein
MLILSFAAFLMAPIGFMRAQPTNVQAKLPHSIHDRFLTPIDISGRFAIDYQSYFEVVNCLEINP